MLAIGKRPTPLPLISRHPPLSLETIPYKIKSLPDCPRARSIFIPKFKMQSWSLIKCHPLQPCLARRTPPTAQAWSNWYRFQQVCPFIRFVIFDSDADHPRAILDKARSVEWRAFNSSQAGVGVHPHELRCTSLVSRTTWRGRFDLAGKRPLRLPRSCSNRSSAATRPISSTGC